MRLGWLILERHWLYLFQDENSGKRVNTRSANEVEAEAQPRLSVCEESTVAVGELPYRGVEDLSPAQVSTLKRTGDYELARRGSTGAIFYIAFTIVLIFSTTYAADLPLVVYGSLTAFIAMALIRGLLWLWFEPIYAWNQRLWRALYVGAVLVLAIAWGILSGAALHHYGIDSVSLWTLIITIGLCSAALHSLAMHRLLLRVYLTLMLLPSLFESLHAHGDQSLVLGLTCLAFLLYTQLQGGNLNREFWEARIDAMRLDAATKQRLHNLTYHDRLTGLPTRALFRERLQQALRDRKRSGRLTGVIVLNLDGFKKINETLGHEAGDMLLNEMAFRLDETLRESDSLSRLGGDNFAVALAEIAHARDAARVVRKLLDKLSKPIEVNGLELVVGASAGISVCPFDDDDADRLLAAAESAMFRAKELGGGNYQYFKADMHAQTAERLKLETQLRRALERGEYELYYQPKVDLESGNLSGFEALLRWCPPGSDPVSPATFIPLLEETGLIVPVGEWVLRTACRQNKRWQDMGLPTVRMAVNLSARQLRDADLPKLVQSVLTETGLDARWLELEITESMLMLDTEQTGIALDQLSAMGVHMSIDDFGTGYSSLAYLKRMPIHTLKIDRSFVTDITTDPNDAAVVNAVIAMAHRLNLRVVAEGAETAEQVVFLRDRHCDEMQGYFFSRPLPAHEVQIMLEIGRCTKLDELARPVTGHRAALSIGSPGVG